MTAQVILTREPTLLTVLTRFFERPTYPDDPAACTAFPTERNVGGQHPEESLRAAEPASKGVGILGQPVLCHSIFPSTLHSAPARKGSAAFPVHELYSAMICRTQAATGSASNNGFDRGPAVCLVSAAEGKAPFRTPLPRARNQPSSAADLGQCPAVCAARARPSREGRRGCEDERRVLKPERFRRSPYRGPE
jgi:hypothetical protein